MAYSIYGLPLNADAMCMLGLYNTTLLALLPDRKIFCQSTPMSSSVCSVPLDQFALRWVRPVQHYLAGLAARQVHFLCLSLPMSQV